MTEHTRALTLVILVIIAAVLILFFGWNKFRREELSGIVSGNGRLEATEINISAKFQGRIAEVLFDEGDRIRKGEIAARMDTQALEAQLRESESKENQAEKNLAYSKAILQQRISERDYSEKKYKRYKDLYRKGIISLEQLDLAKSDTDSAIALSEAARADIANAEAAISSAHAASDKIRADIHDCILKAPRDGRVLYRLAEPGEVLPAGGNILTMVDLSDIYMIIFLPESQAGSLSIGADARIVLDAFPDRSFSGYVEYVSPEAQFTPKQVETSTERQKLVFRIKVRLKEGDPSVLKPGMPGLSYIALNNTVTWPDNLK